MFQRALVATDLSDASDRIVEYTTTLHALGCHELVLAHAICVKHTLGLSGAMQAEIAPQLLTAQQQRLAVMGFSVTTALPMGVPGPELIALAHSKACHCLVIGSHGHSLVRDIILGGVTTDMIHRADIPILVLRMVINETVRRPHYRIGDGDVFGHLLYATDFSETAERAFGYVELLVQHEYRHVTVLHVQDRTQIAPHLEARIEELNTVDRARLERLQRRLLDIGAKQVDVALPYGNPAREILAMTEHGGVSLVVMGTHGRGYISNFVMGRVSHNIVRLSQVPALLIPPIR